MSFDKSIDIGKIGIVKTIDDVIAKTKDNGLGNKNPYDLEDINYNGFGLIVSGVDDIAQSWHIILNTIPGSDPLRAAFGSGVFNYIDKPVNQYEGDFASQIIKDLERWEKRATISQVKRTIYDGKVAAHIEGLFTETNTPIQITVDLSDLSTQNLTEIQKAYADSYQDEAYS